MRVIWVISRRTSLTTANNFDHAGNSSEPIADLVGKSSREFTERGQLFGTRQLVAMQPFGLVSALAQMMNHAVEATTEVSDSVVAIGEAYRDIQVAFFNTRNLLLEFHNELAATIATVRWC